MKNYDHRKIEKKWQGTWEKSKIYEAKTGGKGKPFYGLIEFPYPSGAGLHVGHIRSNTAMDIITRKRRMEGYNVLYPIGWDAFGLPTENYAIKMGIDPAKVTKTNTDIFRKQLKSVGFGFDWSREIDTTDPAYVKWTQWIFLQMYKKGLAYKARTTINWCQSCKIGLANEEVVGGVCERCGGQVVKREKEQWMLAITKYADRLDKDLDKVNYLDKIKIQQRNWIGKSEGSEIEFPVKNSSDKIKVFTTRADTIFGATYVVLAPDHELVTKLKSQISNWSDVEKYVKEVKDKPDIERTAEDKVKTGVELKGVKAVNPANGEEVPIWIADYVLATYGTGAIMAVPQHDERDREFATKFNLPIIDKPLVDAKEITDKVHGKIVTKYKLRDWVFSRQRYWGEPIPIIHCDKCGYVPVPERDLPVVLPKVKSYTPTDNGESPLAIISKWVNTTCPKCKGKAKRETDTMPNWAGSSWYFLRYVDPKNKKEFASKKALTYWMKNGVDWYNGGMEHTTLHLLYSRFWHKFLYDLKVVPTTEPYMKRTSHGMILASGGVKMSKSIGNTIDPK
ncbi:TPA: leucine--tRNA ligase, partial [Candidatus Nomurabacteria bacterium]|nr:leucine--tRNA ligase [Candidatus Nomurabacteria bacterium]HBI34621.1 leucine--tRNA ligase [Candidatus Nomurabacteria bacterium]